MILRIILFILFLFILNFLTTIYKDIYSSDMIIKVLIGMVALLLSDKMVNL